MTAGPTYSPEIVHAHTYHGRRGAVENAFRYGVDYVLIDPDSGVSDFGHANRDSGDAPSGPRLFARNRGNLTSLWDCDHGGPPGQGRGVDWLRAVLAARGLQHLGARVRLLAQPRVLGHGFNPVAFWLCFDPQDRLRLAVAEVTNTYGDRHSYLCHRDDLAPLGPQDTVRAQKVLHVSPFQRVRGAYAFRFDIRADRIGIWIDYSAGKDGLVATLTGPRRPMTDRAILAALLRRPLGARRVLALIHWQALKLWWKGAPWAMRPQAPGSEVSR